MIPDFFYNSIISLQVLTVLPLFYKNIGNDDLDKNVGSKELNPKKDLIPSIQYFYLNSKLSENIFLPSLLHCQIGICNSDIKFFGKIS